MTEEKARHEIEAMEAIAAHLRDVAFKEAHA